MLNNLPILSFLTFLPLFGAFVILLTCSDDTQGAKNSKMVALWTSLITFILSIVVLFNFDKFNLEFLSKNDINSWLATNNETRLNKEGKYLYITILDGVGVKAISATCLEKKFD